MSSSLYDLALKTMGKDGQGVPQTDNSADVINSTGLIVRDENVILDTHVKEFNFKGVGVTSRKTSDGRIEVTIEQQGGGATDDNIRNKFNNSLFTIPKFSSVTLNTDGNIYLMDLSIPTNEDFYGITLEDILPNSIGRVQFSGEVKDALLNRGLPPETVIYQTSIAGQINTKAYLPTSAGQLIFRIGFATGLGNDLLLAPKSIVRL